MGDATDETGSSRREPDRDDAEGCGETFDALLDAAPALFRLGERMDRLQRRYRALCESDRPSAEEKAAIESELAEIGEEYDRMNLPDLSTEEALEIGRRAAEARSVEGDEM